MIVRQLIALRGSNVWSANSVFEAALDFADENTWSSADIDRALQALFAIAPEPSASDSDPELRLAQAIALVAKKLQDLARLPVTFSGARPGSRPDIYLAAVEFVEESVGKAAFEAAVRLLPLALAGQTSTLDAEVQLVRDQEYKRRLPLSTAAVYNAARARGIPATRLNPEYRRYLRLGQGSAQHRCLACEPDTSSAVARMASTDKQLAKQLLDEAGVPVPLGRVVDTLEQAWPAACELGLPVAVKPLDADLGTGVSLDLKTREQVEAAFREAEPHGGEVLIERFAPGLEHRLVVVGDRVVAVARIEPPHVVGDGALSIAQLAAKVNEDPRRGEAESSGPLYKLKLDDECREVLAGQGLTLDSVPAAGARVLLRRNPPYIAQGGCLIDVTDAIHPETAAQAVAAAHAVQLPVAGLDVVALDISQPLEEQGGVIVEINTSPGLWLHLAPAADSPRPVGQEIVAELFPAGSSGRIPVVAIVGDKSRMGLPTRPDMSNRVGGSGLETQPTMTFSEHLTSLLDQAGLCAGTAANGEISLNGRRWTPPGNMPHERADVLFQLPIGDVALLHVSPLELVRCGLGNDRCDVAILLDSAAPLDIGDDLGPSPSEFPRALLNGLLDNGILVLPLSEPLPPFEPPLAPQRVIRFAAQADSNSLAIQLSTGGRVVFAQGDDIMLAQGAQSPAPIFKRPGGASDQDLSPLLAALAAKVALGI